VGSDRASKVRAEASYEIVLLARPPGTSTTMYIRVLDWSGSARPDFVYDLSVSGIN
jgi:hypothetical protein